MTPSHLLGVLNQVGIVSGIFTGQCASIALSRQATWRFVPVITAGIAALQILSAAKMKESPVWLAHKAGSPEESNEERDSSFQTDSDAGEKLWRRKWLRRLTRTFFCVGIHDRLLAATAEPTDSEGGMAPRSVSKAPPQTIWGVITSPLTRKGLRIVVITQIAQQASGINAGECMPNLHALMTADVDSPFLSHLLLHRYHEERSADVSCVYRIDHHGRELPNGKRI